MLAALFQAREAALAGRLTGRQLFLRDTTLSLSDVALIQGDAIEIDETLFDEVSGISDLFIRLLFIFIPVVVSRECLMKSWSSGFLFLKEKKKKKTSFPLILIESFDIAKLI